MRRGGPLAGFGSGDGARTVDIADLSRGCAIRPPITNPENPNRINQIRLTAAGPFILPSQIGRSGVKLQWCNDADRVLCLFGEDRASRARAAKNWSPLPNCGRVLEFESAPCTFGNARTLPGDYIPSTSPLHRRLRSVHVVPRPNHVRGKQGRRTPARQDSQPAPNCGLSFGFARCRARAVAVPAFDAFARQPLFRGSSRRWRFLF